nr:type III pantothenate kinase [uncultured Flavobacterium sp.]
MVLVIDVGNTRIKAAVFEGNMLLEVFVFVKEELQENCTNIFKKYPLLIQVVVSSVGFVDEIAFLKLESKLKIHFVTREEGFPFVNKYATPATLGIDRMVLASGAVLQFPGQNRLVIDAGTCVTYDFIDEQDHYLGGAISPGLRLRYESLHNFTAKLPLLTLENPKELIGDSTNSSIHSGVVNGLVYEIDGFIADYKLKYPNFIIILTGGDTVFLAKRLKNTIFANSNFLLESLNRKFHYNIKK